MVNLTKVLFEEGSFNEKKAEIESIQQSELLNIKKSLVKTIIEKCSKDKRFWIDSDHRKGNNWNSLVEEVSIMNGDVFVGIYVQNTKTDTSMSEYFDKFFRRGEYVSSDNHLNERVRYNDKEKAEVMRSILLDCIYWLYNADVQREKLVAKLGHYTIVNPVMNEFYEKLDLWHNEISRYSNRYSVVRRKGYYYGQEKIEEYIKEHAEELAGKSTEELQDIYRKIFREAYNEFDKTFDFKKWRSEQMFLW